MTDPTYDPAASPKLEPQPEPTLSATSAEDQPYDLEPAELEAEGEAATTDDLTVSLDESDH